MRILKQSITSGSDTSKPKGTVFYEVTLHDLKDAVNASNIWLKAVIDESGFDAINLESSLFGSSVLNNKLYICKTDGQPIQVNGSEIDPEEALDVCDLEDLSAYITPATREDILDNISLYEIYPPNLDDMAMNLLEAGYSFLEIVEDAKDLPDISI